MRVRNSILVIAVIAMVGTIGCSSMSHHASRDGDDDGPGVDPRELLGSARTTMVDAIGTAERSAAGRAVEAEMEAAGDGAARHAVYCIDIVRDSGPTIEVIVSAETGAVESTAEETDTDDIAEEKEFRSMLGATDRSLTDLVQEAMGIVRGMPVRAALESEDGIECEVVLAHGGHLIEVGFVGRDGRLDEIELVEHWDDDGHGSRDDRERDRD